MREELKNIIKKTAKQIKEDNKIVIFGHINPDGDAIGSTLGLFHYLKNKVSDVKVIVPNNFPDFLKWMPASDLIIQFDKETLIAEEYIKNADILFFCDFNDLKRMERIADCTKLSKGIKIMIDHHPDPSDFADYTISDTSVSSTAELMYEFIATIEGEEISGKEIAECLLTGIITDTGLFNHNSENKRTFEIAGELIRMGADKAAVIDRLYNQYPFHRMQLLGNALHNRFKFHPDLGAAYIYLSKEDLEKYNYQIGDTEGFVNIALSVAGANVSALFMEKDGYIKISFRSKNNFDVNLFARKHFNGGGHKNASGGKSYHPLNKTVDSFVKLLQEYKNEILNS